MGRNKEICAHVIEFFSALLGLDKGGIDMYFFVLLFEDVNKQWLVLKCVKS